jgi:hypothetical protein
MVHNPLCLSSNAGVVFSAPSCGHFYKPIFTARPCMHFAHWKLWSNKAEHCCMKRIDGDRMAYLCSWKTLDTTLRVNCLFTKNFQPWIQQGKGSTATKHFHCRSLKAPFSSWSRCKHFGEHWVGVTLNEGIVMPWATSPNKYFIS